jgi:hypothetical protein
MKRYKKVTPCGMQRNNTNFPIQIKNKLAVLYKKFLTGDDANGLKYYQYLVRELVKGEDLFSVNADGRLQSRGLLLFHDMGMGKTRLAASLAWSLRDEFTPLVILPKSLQDNFAAALKLVSDDRMSAQYLSSDAFNVADQLERDYGNLEGKVVFIDEAHDFFRSIVNSSNENSNAFRLYRAILRAKNIRIFFMTGTPSAKHPFELVPCFNMLAGGDLLPPNYETFSEMFIDGEKLKNANVLANRIMGMVSYGNHDVSAAKTGASVPDIPEEMPLKVEYVEMTPDQYNEYLLVRAKERKELEGKSRGKHGGPATRIRDMALPGASASTGSTYHVKSRGIGNYFERDGVSPKIEAAVGNIAKSEGPVILYSQFVGNSGLASVEKFLNRDGYERFVPTDNAVIEVDPSAVDYSEAEPSTEEAEPVVINEGDGTYTAVEGGNALAAAFAGDSTAKVQSVDKRKRYAIISGEVPVADRTRILKMFNQPANTHGDLIKVLLISKTGAQGLDTMALRQVHILEPYWDKAREDQVNARAKRIGSHANLPIADRNFQPYLYIATHNKSMFNNLDPETREEHTIDEQFHLKALRDKRLNMAMRSLLRSVSLECGFYDLPDCRMCRPTGAPLFTGQIMRDLSLPDPCVTLEETEVEAEKVEIGEKTYYWRPTTDNNFGYIVFAYNTELEAWTELSLNSTAYHAVLGKIEDSAGGHV